MRIPSAGYRRELRVNMTPMIDVVFLLIIFFLVSSHLARQESQLPLPLPTAESGEEVVSDQKRVVINVTADGTKLLSGRSVGFDELVHRLSTESQQSGGLLEARIRSDRHVAFQHVQPILLAVAKSGVQKVTFAVTKRGAANP